MFLSVLRGRLDGDLRRPSESQHRAGGERECVFFISFLAVNIFLDWPKA